MWEESRGIQKEHPAKHFYRTDEHQYRRRKCITACNLLRSLHGSLCKLASGQIRIWSHAFLYFLQNCSRRFVFSLQLLRNPPCIQTQGVSNQVTCKCGFFPMLLSLFLECCASCWTFWKCTKASHVYLIWKGVTCGLPSRANKVPSENALLADSNCTKSCQWP